MKKNNAWKIRHLVNEMIVPAYYIKDCRIYGQKFYENWANKTNVFSKIGWVNPSATSFRVKNTLLSKEQITFYYIGAEFASYLASIQNTLGLILLSAEIM